MENRLNPESIFLYLSKLEKLLGRHRFDVDFSYLVIKKLLHFYSYFRSTWNLKHLHVL